MSEIPVPEPAEESVPRRGFSRYQPLLAVTIALVAIVLAAWEGLENRRHNRLTVQPRLGGEVYASNDGTMERVTLKVENNGLGPAVVRSFRIYLDGRLVEKNWPEIIPDLSSPGVSLQAHGLGAGYFVPAGREYVLFEASRPRSDTTMARLQVLLDRVAVDVCYCSVYGTHCDRVTLATRALQLTSCPKP